MTNILTHLRQLQTWTADGPLLTAPAPKLAAPGLRPELATTLRNQVPALFSIVYVFTNKINIRQKLNTDAWLAHVSVSKCVCASVHTMRYGILAPMIDD